jgi:hypothetical protein
VRNASGATGVQIVWSSRRGSRRLEHLGSAHDEGEVAALRRVGEERIAAGQQALDLGLDPAAGTGPLQVVAWRAGHLWGALARAYDTLGFTEATDADEVFRALVLYDVSTLYFEIDQGDGFREPGFSKERRLEPQITIGLLADAVGFPLRVEAFEGNKTETATMLPRLRRFMAAHRLTDITVVADAGMLSQNNKREIEAAGLGFIIGNRIAQIPYVISEWHQQNPDTDVPNGLILTQPWPAGSSDKRRDQVIYYQYRAERARRSLAGIDEQISKAQKAVDGKAPVKRNRFITLTGGEKNINRDLEAKARTLAGWKSYITNIANPSPQFVIDAYHQLWHIEKAFRMSKHDLRARPIYHHKRESIEAHLAVVFAALAVTHQIQRRTGWSIKRFVTTARRYRTIDIRIGGHVVPAEEQLPPELCDVLALIT